MEKYRTNLCEYKGKAKVLIPVTHMITNLKGGFHLNSGIDRFLGGILCFTLLFGCANRLEEFNPRLGP